MVRLFNRTQQLISHSEDIHSMILLSILLCYFSFNLVLSILNIVSLLGVLIVALWASGLPSLDINTYPASFSWGAVL